MAIAGVSPMDKFQGLLCALTSSKESIQMASKFFIENADLADDFMNAIGDRLSTVEVSSKQKMALFFLLDSIGQNAAKTGKTYVVSVTGNCIRRKIKFIVDSPGQIDNLPQIEKAVTLWKARDIFSTDVVRTVLASVESSKSRPKPSDAEKTIRKIEEIRRRQKHEQQESCLRPPNDSPFAELDELQRKIDEEEAEEIPSPPPSSPEHIVQNIPYNTIPSTTIHQTYTDDYNTMNYTHHQPNPNEYQYNRYSNEEQQHNYNAHYNHMDQGYNTMQQPTQGYYNYDNRDNYRQDYRNTYNQQPYRPRSNQYYGDYRQPNEEYSQNMDYYNPGERQQHYYQRGKQKFSKRYKKK